MKKTLAVILALAVLCIMAVGGTMSYLTYTDYDVNTMVVGNVTITQFEQYRNNSGVLTDWHDNKGTVETFDDVHHSPAMLPVVGVTNDPGNYTPFTINGNPYNLSDTTSVIDKIVYVKNTGNQEAYVRTVFAFEMMYINGNWENPLGNYVGTLVNGSIDFSSSVIIYKNGSGYSSDPAGATAAYIVGIYTYGTLAKDQFSAPSLLQIYATKDVTNDFYTAIDGQYEVLVLSQAVQAVGFGTSSEGFDEAFGQFTAAKAAEWFNTVNP